MGLDISNPILTETQQAHKPPMVLHHFPCAMLECHYILDFNNSPKNFLCKNQSSIIKSIHLFDIKNTKRNQKHITNFNSRLNHFVRQKSHLLKSQHLLPQMNTTNNNYNIQNTTPHKSHRQRSQRLVKSGNKLKQLPSLSQKSQIIIIVHRHTQLPKHNAE